MNLVSLDNPCYARSFQNIPNEARHHTRVKMLQFNGKNAKALLFKAWRYFLYYNILDDKKILLHFTWMT